MSRRGALVPIHGPLYIVTDDVVHPVGGDEKDPECGLITRRYLQRLVLSQRVRYLREGLLGFLQAFIDSIHHTSEGGGSLTPEAAPGALARPVVRCIASSWCACSPGSTNHTITL